MKSERQLLQETLAAGETPELTLDELLRHARLTIVGLRVEIAALHADPTLCVGADVEVRS